MNRREEKKRKERNTHILNGVPVPDRLLRFLLQRSDAEHIREPIYRMRARQLDRVLFRLLRLFPLLGRVVLLRRLLSRILGLLQQKRSTRPLHVSEVGSRVNPLAVDSVAFAVSGVEGEEVHEEVADGRVEGDELGVEVVDDGAVGDVAVEEAVRGSSYEKGEGEERTRP